MFKYKVEVNWSEEDHTFIANVPELKGCKTHGSTPIEAMEMAQDAIDGYIEMLKNLGDPVPTPLSVKDCSGRVTIRMKPNLHRDLINQAEVEGLSLNEYMIKNLKVKNDSRV
ncbi:MAG: toxin-antitoxin system HicB family antitoxin [Candidatus Cloacimonadota bacterium]|nr:MAG: toxin-antitoxin system HicB family antitoxin [Candidatus Cloacimonadota bacterium]